MDVATIYADARTRVIDLMLATPVAQLDTPVGGTPGWSAHDVLAHMVGVPSDVLAGRLDGVGSDAWGNRQVEERRGRSVPELAEEWQAGAEQFVGLVASAPEGMAGALVADVVQHELDLRGALGVAPPESMAPGLDFGLNFMAGYLDTRVKKAGLAALVVRGGSQEWTLGPGQAGATLTTTPLEFFRILAGRRSEAQVAALDWDGEPGPYLAVLSAFGPLPAADVVERLEPA